MAKNRKKSGSGTVRRIFLALSVLALVIITILYGHNVAVFNPKGLVANEQHQLLLLIIGGMLIIAIPAVFLVYFVAWKYRESNTKATHDPDHRHSKFMVFNIWFIPTVFMVAFSLVLVPATHKLDPRVALASDVKPLTIQVIAMRWKWLFIYPQQNIATVNYVKLPAHTPVQFELTADEAPFSSFWVPNIGGQLYAMSGMSNHLNLMADTLGNYVGSSAEINGAGFAGMKFTASVGSQADFDSWVQNVRESSDVLDTAGYDRLLKPSENNPATFYSGAYSDLYDTVLMKYMDSMGTMDHGVHE